MKLKYTVIKNKTQYKDYCNQLEELLGIIPADKGIKDEIELLTLLIEKWDAAHNSFADADPVTLLQSLMKANGLKSKDMVAILGISKGYVSDILRYRKGLSKEVIRKLSDYFKVSQEAFNHYYPLVTITKPVKVKRNTGKRSKVLA